MICIHILATKTICLCLTPTSSGKQKRKTFELTRHWKSSHMIFQKWQNLENKVRTEASLAEDLGLGNLEEKRCKPSHKESKTKRDSASMCKCHSLFDGWHFKKSQKAHTLSEGKKQDAWDAVGAEKYEVHPVPVPRPNIPHGLFSSCCSMSWNSYISWLRDPEMRRCLPALSFAASYRTICCHLKKPRLHNLGKHTNHFCI